MAHTEDACKEFEMMWEYDQSYMKNPPTKKIIKKCMLRMTSTMKARMH